MARVTTTGIFDDFSSLCRIHLPHWMDPLLPLALAGSCAALQGGFPRKRPPLGHPPLLYPLVESIFMLHTPSCPATVVSGLPRKSRNMMSEAGLGGAGGWPSKNFAEPRTNFPLLSPLSNRASHHVLAYHDRWRELMPARCQSEHRTPLNTMWSRSAA